MQKVLVSFVNDKPGLVFLAKPRDLFHCVLRAHCPSGVSCATNFAWMVIRGPGTKHHHNVFVFFYFISPSYPLVFSTHFQTPLGAPNRRAEMGWVQRTSGGITPAPALSFYRASVSATHLCSSNFLDTMRSAIRVVEPQKKSPSIERLKRTTLPPRSVKGYCYYQTTGATGRKRFFVRFAAIHPFLLLSFFSLVYNIGTERKFCSCFLLLGTKLLS